MDAYVVAVRDLDITKYSVSNTLGIKETRTAYAMGTNMTYEVKKDKINLEDILNGDNPVGKAMVDEWENYLKNNPGAKDLSYADYQKAALYSGAFEYESISDGQKKKEFWFNMAALATTVVVGIFCPPAGMALGVALGGYEMLNAAVGKDLLSGRELGTGERWFRFGTGALGVFGGVKGLTSFSKNINMVKGASSTKMEHVVKMIQNSGRSNYKSITSQAKALQAAQVADRGKYADRLDYLHGKYGKMSKTELNQRMNLRGETMKELENVRKTTSKNKLGPAFAGAFDKSTGKYNFATNNYDGLPPNKWAPQLEKLFAEAPDHIKDSYEFTKGFGSHAEIYAANEALLANPNANIKDIVINVVRTGQNKAKPAGMMFSRCPHCAYMLDGFDIISEVSKVGR